MRRLATSLSLAALVLLALAVPAVPAADRPIKGPLIVHNVFFTLKDRSPETRDKLVAACKKYLTGHPGEVAFAAGTREESLDQPVNDRDFDVGLHIVFKDRAAHDKYQVSERHKQFIEENKDTWKKVRVF